MPPHLLLAATAAMAILCLVSSQEQAVSNRQQLHQTHHPLWRGEQSQETLHNAPSTNQRRHGLAPSWPHPAVISPWDWPSQQPTSWEFRPRKGLSRLLEQFGGGTNGGGGGGEEGADEEEGEGEERGGGGSRPPLLSPDMNRPHLSTNLERYMPLLAKQKTIRTRNATEGAAKARGGHRGGGGHHLVDSREFAAAQSWRAGGGPEEGDNNEEDESSMEAVGAAGGVPDGGGPCVTANCRTWITITIPSELVGIPPGIGLPGAGGEGGQKQQKPDGGADGGQQKPKAPNPLSPTSSSKPAPPPIAVLPGSKPMPPFPPKPMTPQNSKSRGFPAPKNRPAQGTPAPPPSASTRAQPPDFVFSTKWILPVNGLSIRPNISTSPSPSSPSIFTTSPSPPPSPIGQITTATIGRGGAGNSWGQRPPFVLRPRPKVVPAASSSSTAGPLIPLPRERPPFSAKAGPRPKPWTHSSSNVPKGRPVAVEKPQIGPPSQPLSPDTTIEQAAIWASTELIDAIREALAKFRATLNRNNGGGERGDAAAQADEQQQKGGALGAAEAERELQTQLKAAWDSLRGTWLEQAVAELAQQADALGGQQAANRHEATERGGGGGEEEEEERRRGDGRRRPSAATIPHWTTDDGRQMRFVP